QVSRACRCTGNSEYGWPRANLFRQWVRSTEAADVQTGQTHGGSNIGLRQPGAHCPAACSSQHDTTKWANSGLTSGDIAAQKACTDHGCGAYFFRILNINCSHSYMIAVSPKGADAS